MHSRQLVIYRIGDEKEAKLLVDGCAGFVLCLCMVQHHVQHPITPKLLLEQFSRSILCLIYKSSFSSKTKRDKGNGHQMK